MRRSRQIGRTLDGGADRADETSGGRAWGPYPSPRSEARFLIRSIGRNGGTLENLRRCIVPTVDDDKALRSLAAQDRQYGEQVLRVLDFRSKVLAELDLLVSDDQNGEPSTAAPRSRTRIPKALRSCPECGRVFKSMTEAQWKRAYAMHKEVSLAHGVGATTSGRTRNAACDVFPSQIKGAVR